MRTSSQARSRAALCVALSLAAGALVLASCAPAKVAVEHLLGTPALSISVPLSSVSCTLDDVCVATGSTSQPEGTSSVAEFSTPHGRWLNLRLPTSPTALIDATACSGAQCLISGSQPGGDLLWRFDAATHTVAPATPPPDGRGVVAIGCNGSVCALIDAGPGGTTRFSSSEDGGLTWTNPLAMPWATGDAVTDVSCGQIFDCVVSALSRAHVLSVHVTLDGGATWTTSTTPATWTALSSLSCQVTRCVALAQAARTALIVRTTNLGVSWTSKSLTPGAAALACTAWRSCVVVGQRTNAGAWLAKLRHGVTTDAALRYVPTPLFDVACGTKVCAAIAVTTLVSIPASS